MHRALVGLFGVGDAEAFEIVHEIQILHPYGLVSNLGTSGRARFGNMVRRSASSKRNIAALHKVIEKPMGKPVNRSLTRPNGAAHQPGKGSALKSRQLISIRKAKSGYQPVFDTIGSALSRLAAIIDSAGT